MQCPSPSHSVVILPRYSDRSDTMPMIQVQSVSRRFQRGNQVVDALIDCSIDIEQGACVVVRGPSGSGKTTLLMAMGGLQRPTSGSVIVDGCSIWDGSETSRAACRSKSVGFVFQDPHLLPWLNARDNIAIAAQGPASMKDIDQCLEDLGLADRAGHLPGELSTGERRRIALARALVNTPAVLLADEPMSHLDRESASSVLEILSSWCMVGGTVVMVSHVEQLPPCEHRFVDLVEGRLHEQGMVEGKADAT